MTKIKFKTEYKSLPDEVINRHKNFDALLAAYVVAPKLNFFQKLLKNKWTMFSGGIIIGTVVTLFVTLNDQTSTQNNQVANESVRSIENNISKSTAGNENADIIRSKAESPVMELSEIEKGSDKLIAAENAKINYDKKEIQAVNANKTKPLNNTINNDLNNFKENESGNTGKGEELASKGATIDIVDQSFKNEDKFDQEGLNKLKSLDTPVVEEELNDPVTDITAETQNDPAVIDPIVKEDTTQKNNIITKETLAFDQPNKTILPIENPSQNTIKKNDEKESETTALKPAEKEEYNISVDTTSSKEFTFLDKLFEKKIFDRDTTVDLTSGNNKNNISNSSSDSSDFIDRYAQLSFFTPLGTNGLDSYKYKHHFSVNIIQGYNGAVQGLEVGGVANFDKGYMQGGQFAGVTNIVAGNILGIQGAGVLNAGKSLTGGQFAGVANLNTGKIKGMQAAGVINVSSSIKEEAIIFQAAGVANVSLSDNATGFQASGVLNLANNIQGTQIGLVNVAKSVTGVQIGLVNIADTIDGVSIGLLSFSRNGIFDVDIFTSDILTTNIGLRVGSKYVYNIFAFGVSPFSDTLRYGYGLGIGGHIPAYKDLSVDIDGMIWNTFEDQFDFNYDQLHILNQLRITPSYTFANNKITVYAGPVLNVEVYDNGVVPLKENTIQEFGGNGITTSLSLGYVIGLRFF